MSNTVKYKDGLLAKNSEAYELYEKKEFNKLDKHLKSLLQKEKDLITRFDQMNSGKQPTKG